MTAIATTDLIAELEDAFAIRRRHGHVIATPELLASFPAEPTKPLMEVSDGCDLAIACRAVVAKPSLPNGAQAGAA